MTKKQSASKPRAKSLATQEREMDLRERELQVKLVEATTSLYDNFIDPLDAYRDDITGEMWTELGSGGRQFKEAMSETSLAGIRSHSRKLVQTNEWAINGTENRISYVVGTGHKYTAAAKPNKEVLDDTIEAVQEFINEWRRVNKWQRRQQEIRRRIDRDGEVFIRSFVDGTGMTTYRFVEPEQIYTPTELSNVKRASFGIMTNPDDVETVEGYFVDGVSVEPAEIQHRKANVDSNVKRGIPLWFPVRKNLQRAEKLQRNMGVVADIQTAIALIRKHPSASKSAVEDFVNTNADVSVNNTRTGATTYHKHFGPGTILDAHGGTEYDFPAKGIDATRFVIVLQSELRAVASRLVMPEFMLTSDSSNANYASTMVSEGPAVKFFSRIQADTWEADEELLWQAIATAVEANRLPAVDRSEVGIDVTFPTLETHDRLKETQADQILVQNKAMSTRTMGERYGLDMDAEEERIAETREKNDPYGGLGGKNSDDSDSGDGTET